MNTYELKLIGNRIDGFNPAEYDDESNMYSQEYYYRKAANIAEKADKGGYSLRELMDFDDLILEIPKQFR